MKALIYFVTLVIFISMFVVGCGAPKVSIMIMPAPHQAKGTVTEKLTVNETRIKYQGSAAKDPEKAGDPWPTGSVEYGDNATAGPGGIIVKTNIFHGTGSTTDADASVPVSLTP